MASIRKRNGKFQVRWRDHGLARSKSFETARDARTFKSVLETEQARGDWMDPRLSSQPLSEVAAKWLSTQQGLAPRTVINIEGRVRNHLLPHLGRKPLSALRPSDVDAWIAALSEKGLSASIVRHAFQDLDQIFVMAVRDKLVRQTPCIGVKLPTEARGSETTFLSHAEVAALAKAIAPRFRALIYAASYAGLRAGELGALRVPRVNLLARKIEVAESVAEVRGELVSGPPKSKQRRTVKVPGFLADMLAQHITAFPGQEDLVFTSAQGHALRHRNFVARNFKPAVISAGLPPGLRFHDLRHTCAAILIDEGWTLEQLKRHLGHASIRTTSDRYSHLFRGHDDELLERLDARVRSLPTTEADRAVVPISARAG